MKEGTEETLRQLFLLASHDGEALERVQFCLEQIFKSRVSLHDKVTPDAPAVGFGMDFEELSGALLGAEVELKTLRRMEEKREEEEEEE